MQGRNRDADIEKGLMDMAGEEDSGTNRESSTDMYTPACVKQTASGKLLHSTGSPAGCSVMTERGGMREGREAKEGGDVHIYTYNYG